MSDRIVVDCLGTVLTVIQEYADGSYNCPSCGYAVRATEAHCQNPCCFTRPGFPAEQAREIIKREEARKASAAQWEARRLASEATREAERLERDRIRGQRCEDCNACADVEHANPNGRKVFLCRDCERTEARRAGKFKFIGRNRTAEEAAARIVGDKAMRRVKWTAEGNVLVGRDGDFEIRLHCDAAKVLGMREAA